MAAEPPVQPDAQATVDALPIVLNNFENRIKALETAERKTGLKKFSEDAARIGLFLGLILSVSSLYDVFVKRPQADRLAAVSQFNQAVNSAIKTRQELIQQSQAADPAVRLQLAGMATPRILNDIATARSLLPALSDEDVGIPQLTTLISESMTAGDVASALAFAARANAKQDLNPALRSEARRYQGKLFFYIGKMDEARQSYAEAEALYGNSLLTASPRAFVLADLVGSEFAVGSCAYVDHDIGRLAQLLSSPSVPAEVRVQLTSAVKTQLGQFSGRTCPTPKNLALLGQ